jgi:carbonic anhydrase
MTDGRDTRARESCRKALERLLNGNRRFVEDRPKHPRSDRDRRAMLRGGQRPFAAIVGCADSRVPIARVFDQGLGDLFSVRVAGNVAAPVVVGSVEFAVDVLGVEVVGVLGHEGCGAVEAALDGSAATESLRSIIDEITPALRELGREGDGDPLDAAVRANSIHVADALLTRSEVLRERVAEGRLLIVPLLYRLASGSVERLDVA